MVGEIIPESWATPRGISRAISKCQYVAAPLNKAGAKLSVTDSRRWLGGDDGTDNGYSLGSHSISHQGITGLAPLTGSACPHLKHSNICLAVWPVVIMRISHFGHWGRAGGGGCGSSMSVMLTFTRNEARSFPGFGIYTQTLLRCFAYCESDRSKNNIESCLIKFAAFSVSSPSRAQSSDLIGGRSDR